MILEIILSASVGALASHISSYFEIWQKFHDLTVGVRWQQAVSAQKAISDIWGNPRAHAALQMLDWDGRTYRCDERVTGSISFEFRNEALRIEGDEKDFTEDEIFVRDVFDELFSQISILQQAMKIKAIRLEDVHGWFLFYVKCLSHERNVSIFHRFMVEYDYPLVLDFLKNFDVWCIKVG
ncbi:hypothetical protein LRK24_03905 [Rhodanobacter denitrificans]|uniref:Uncharacterized protein n=1 Tax=Rhodanobacter denitrificans TaxID=666685 RepID=M4NKC7_9GAMM|nr:hypothetical protein [Rhodanobacter denitrificans]AGG90522.1 hypothetical protein R2APBS1_3459 [Rhodanobacter denitrificans]UJJ57203.1 hypothetical protein LRK55_11000 [Rhodanobacter denitrificans]UJM85905.1 hypothetical protein LRJ86_14110 [Rhodanobacter denitrificans]UJM91063.1 hypothetical protein LRK24_03905 [Rhodanobacter denitrificans]